MLVKSLLCNLSKQTSWWMLAAHLEVGQLLCKQPKPKYNILQTTIEMILKHHIIKPLLMKQRKLSC